MDAFSVILLIVTGVGLTTFLLRLESWPSNRLAGPFPAGILRGRCRRRTLRSCGGSANVDEDAAWNPPVASFCDPPISNGSRRSWTRVSVHRGHGDVRAIA